MSAPDTNPTKQVSRHRGPIVGISIGLAAVAILFLVFLTTQTDGEETPETAVVTTDG